MYLIAGLGNPGGEYEHTRHNAGFDVVDANAECIDVAFEEDGDDVHVVIYLGGTQNTITINGYEEAYRG